jgi:hypothetical protein
MGLVNWLKRNVSFSKKNNMDINKLYQIFKEMI